MTKHDERFNRHQAKSCWAIYAPTPHDVDTGTDNLKEEHEHGSSRW
jgi:hypothetical protein